MPAARSMATSGRRLFAALELPPPVRTHLATAAALAREACDEAGAQTDLVRWTDPSSWHVTLAFYGPVGADVEYQLAGQIASAGAESSPLTLRIGGAGRFGQRVLWAGVEADVGLTHLADALMASAVSLGVALDDRPYRPHLTLARGRPHADLRPAVAALRDVVGPSWVADQVALVHSRLGAGPDGGALHEVVGSWPLTGRPG